MRLFMLIAICIVFISTITTPAHAYLGPGLGAGTLTVIIGFIVSILLAVIAFVWYPIKRILRKMKSDDGSQAK